MIRESKSCIVCAGEARLRAIQRPYTYFQCNRCQTSFLHPIPSDVDLAEFYEQYHTPQTNGGSFYRSEPRTAADFPAKLGLLRRVSGLRVGKILDVGCGKGYFVEVCCNAGYDAYGIDVSRKAVEAAVARGLPCRAGELSSQSDWHSVFDVVTCFATIEHVPRPHEFLSSIRKVLRPGGWLFIDTGLAGDWVEHLAPGFCQWYDAPQHIFVFSDRGLIDLLENAGLKVHSVDRCFERTAVRKLAKLARNALLSFMLTPVYRLALGNRAFLKLRQEAKVPWGNLLMVIARKAH